MTQLHLAPLLDERFQGECLADPRRRLTYDELRAAVATTATLLEDRGVRRGDTVATVLANRIELVVTLYAAWSIGASVTPVNPALTADEIAYQLADAAVQVAVVEPETAPKVAATTLDAGTIFATPPAGGRPRALPGGDELALVIYTSGTTGRPKGVMLDHANLAAMTAMIAAQTRIGAGDRALLVLPLFHVNAIMVSVVTPLALGASTVIRAKFDAASFWADVEGERPTYFSGVPAVFFFLTILPSEVRPDTSSLRMAICGAAPMPAEAIADFEHRYPIPVIEGYGLSESTVALTFNPLDAPKPGTVGVPIDGVEVHVVDDDGNRLPPGVDGEVVARGPNVMRGYLGQPEETAAALRDGWLHTGDIGHLDQDGYLVLVDRKKDLIIRGGENISPTEVESVLTRHPSILEAAVVGRPHRLLGEEPVAFVVPAPDRTVDHDEIRQHCRAVLAAFKVPKELVVVDRLPRNAVGKVLKVPLRERLSGQPGS
jgi:acyl-CoA synthetase (AMP-forming)/AMP-acid ligase II